MTDESPTAVRTDPDSDRLKEVAERARKRFDAVWSVQSPERALCLEDRRFYSIQGAQWDDAWGAQFENAPRMEVNKTHKEVVRILSDYRNNRVTVDFRPKDDEGDDETADGLDGLFRADVEESGGQEAHDCAFEEGVGGGMGATRLRACYEDEGDPDNDYQRILFEPIPDADQRVFFGPSMRQDKADAPWCIVLNPLSPEQYEEDYPEASRSDFATPQPSGGFEWNRADVVYVAEYYEVEEEKALKVVLVHPIIEDELVLMTPSLDEVTEKEAEGWTVSRRRKIKRNRIHKYLISGSEVLSDEGRIAGEHIPIVPNYGKRWFVENVERCAGHVRYAKDPQRIYNAEISQLAEIAGASPFERPIFDPEQVAGLEQQWADANIQRLPYSLARALRSEVDGTVQHMGPIGTVSPPQVPQALAALIQVSGQDIAELIGATDQQEEVPSNVSAQAIELVHTRADAKTFIYLDNFKQYMRRVGEVWLSMCSELYVEIGRKMQALDQNGGRKYVTLGEPGLAKSGEQLALYDFSKAKYDVVVDVGPSSTTRRDATVRSLMGMSQATSDPELQNVLTSVALMNMEGEGIDDVQQWIRKRLVRQGVVQPTEEEQAELAQEAQQQQPDPQAMLAQGMTQQALAEAEKAKAGTIKVLAEKEKIEAQVMEILAGISREDRQQVLDALNADADRLVNSLPNPLHDGAPQPLQ